MHPCIKVSVSKSKSTWMKNCQQNVKQKHISAPLNWLKGEITFSLSILFWQDLQLCLVSSVSCHFSLNRIFAVIFLSVNGKDHFVCNRAVLFCISRSSHMLLSAMVHMSPCAGSLCTDAETLNLTVVNRRQQKHKLVNGQANKLTVLYFSWMSIEVCVCWMST